MNLLSDYDVKIVDKVDTIICELKRGDTVYFANVTQDDLKSGCVRLQQFKNIILSNAKESKPNFEITCEEITNVFNQTKQLHLTINYLTDLIEFKEVIHFNEKGLMMGQNDEINELKLTVVKLEKQIIEQQKVIDKIGELERTVLNLTEKLSTQINDVKQTVTQIEPFIVLKFSNEILPINVDKLEMDVVKEHGQQLVIFIKFYYDNTNMFCGKNVWFSFVFDGSCSQCRSCFHTYDVYGQKCTHAKLSVKKTNNHFGSFGSNEYSDRNNTQYGQELMDQNSLIKINVKKLIIRYNQNTSDKGFVMSYFLNFYLSNKINFTIDEINIVATVNTIHYLRLCIDILLRHNNYKKLLINFDRSFNDTTIKTHCESNNIEFGYIDT
jgi:hypothetical protein